MKTDLAYLCLVAPTLAKINLAQLNSAAQFNMVTGQVTTIAQDLAQIGKWLGYTDIGSWWESNTNGKEDLWKYMHTLEDGLTETDK